MGAHRRSCTPQPAAPAAGGTQVAVSPLQQLSKAWPPLAQVAAQQPEPELVRMPLHLGKGCMRLTPPPSRAVHVEQAGPEAGLPSPPLGVQCMATLLRATSRRCAAPRYKAAEPNC